MYQWRRETLDKGNLRDEARKYQPEQVVSLLRQIEVAVANRKTTAQAAKEAGIVEQTYFCWRKEYGGLQEVCQRTVVVADGLEDDTPGMLQAMKKVSEQPKLGCGVG